jgi:anti-anti-sigma factor
VPRPEEQEQHEGELLLTAVHHQGRDAAWLALEGELDRSGGPQLSAALREALGDSVLVVLDLRALAFIDSAGLAVIAEANDRAAQDGQRLVIIQGPRQIEALMALAGLPTVLEVADLGPDGLHVASLPSAPAP